MLNNRPSNSSNSGPEAGNDREQAIAALFEVVANLMREVRPRAKVNLRLGSDLDRDLGLDSLALVELMARLEQAFGVELPDEVLANARTLGDLLELLHLTPVSARPTTAAGAGPAVQDAGGPGSGRPEQAGTWSEVLEWHLEHQAQRLHLRLLDSTGAVEELSYASLAEQARLIAGGLRARGTEPGDRIALMLPTGRGYFESFLGVLLAGAVPVPIYPPWRKTQLEDHLLRQAGILDNAQAHTLVTVPEARLVGRQLKLAVPGLRHVLTADQAASGHDPVTSWPATTGSDLALLQYTSGSTGAPKGVMLSHAALLANVRAMGEAAGVEAGSDDVFVSWLPLYHDMGLIGAWLAPLYFGIPLVVMPPTSFLRRPASWLRTIHEHRGTLSASPNFGYELCLNRITDEQMDGLDLSRWRLAFNGAEPVSPQTLERFAGRFGSWGFRPEAMTPVYGLAEGSLGLTFPPLGRGPIIDRIAREPFWRSGQAVPATDDESTPLTFVGCGVPLAGHRVRIVDSQDRPLADRQQGRIEFSGPSATSGYHRNPEATTKLIQGDWLDTGDLGYLAGGELYVTGRVKDMVIRLGRNIHPQELEQAVGEVPGIRKGRTAVFGARDPAAGSERLVVLTETNERDGEKRSEMIDRIRTTGIDLLGAPPDDIVLAQPGTVLKTSSGKIRRAACRELYEQDKLGAETKPFWRQITSLVSAAAAGRLARVPTQARSLLYALYAWILFAVIGLLVWILMVMVPGAGLRWWILKYCGRALFVLGGMRPKVSGTGNYPDGPCVVVANHASMLDGLLLATILPRRLKFIAAEVFERQKISGTFLRRIGAEFVERKDRAKASAVPKALQAAAGEGLALVLFPEGRMSRRPGLQPFRVGAFTVAAETGLPVVPITIKGTGAILRADARYPRHSSIEIIIGEPITPGTTGWSEAVRMSLAAREQILAHLGEPDLEQ